jgi:PhoH-like ATPase
VVLEELDKFKRGNDIINFHAREFTRELDKLSGDMLLTANIPLVKTLEICILKQEGIFLKK